jgi:predicted nucleic acid-binding protein
MTNKAWLVNSYVFRPEDELFLDANVWLFIYGPQRPGDKRVAKYSDAFAKILNAQSRIYIDVLIISEFFNTYARLQWKQVAPNVTNFKKFRKSPSFKPIAHAITSDVKRILKHCTRIENGFETLDIDSLIAEYEAGDADFNDQVITSLCKNRGLKLVTDDGDFRLQGIPVVTANKKLLT